MRHAPGKPCVFSTSHHLFAASVHWRARSKSPIPCELEIVTQYTTVDENGSSSPINAEVEASSSSAVAERGALRDEGESLEVGAAEALADVVGALRLRERLVELARPKGGDRADERRLPVLPRLRLLGEQPLAARLPAAEERALALAEVVEREPDRDTARVHAVALVEERFVGALPQGK